MHRSCAVADQFYPGDPATLKKLVANLIPSEQTKKKQKALAVLSPHAGYIYSGGVAGETLGTIEVPQDVLLMGPNHQGLGAPASLMEKGYWDMPMGSVPINETLAGLVLEKSALVEADIQAHKHEHSLEVQVPFLQYLQPKLRITPLVISHFTYNNLLALGKSFARAIKSYGQPVLMVASTDMTHYESRQQAEKKDKLALDRVLALDAKGLFDTVLENNISMCGIMPSTIALVAALELGATNAEIIRYTDSGEASGDTNRVVGYAGVIIS